MKKRQMGQSGLKVSAIGLGCMGMSHGYGVRDDAESAATLERAFELGVDFFDTADMYGAGHNEELIGRFMAGRRDKIVLATKCGFVWDETGKVTKLDGTPKYIKAACEASLKRLQTEVIDLYYLHRADPQVPIEESIAAMSELVKEGKIRFIGLSEVSVDELRRAHKIHPIAALQSQYSLWARNAEAEIIPMCRQLGISFVAYGPLGSGFLTGQIKDAKDLRENDLRRRVPRFQEENFLKNLELVEIIKQFAAEKGFTPAQITLAWALARGQDIIPIPGTKRRKYLEENLRALEVLLTDDDLRNLEEKFPLNAAAGSLRSEKMKRMMGVG